MQAEPPAWPVRARLRVLMVDDDPVILEVVGDWLREAGHEVHTRTAGVGTAADIIGLRPDLVLLDVLMPGLRGDDLVRLLKRHPATAGVPVVLHSCLPSETLRPLIMTTGALGALEKSANRVAFLFAFGCLTTRLRPAAHNQDSHAAGDAAAMSSGTHRVARDARAGDVPSAAGPPERFGRGGLKR